MRTWRRNSAVGCRALFSKVREQFVVRALLLTGTSARRHHHRNLKGRGAPLEEGQRHLEAPRHEAQLRDRAEAVHVRACHEARNLPQRPLNISAARHRA
jgi:hypothetical protein